MKLLKDVFQILSHQEYQNATALTIYEQHVALTQPPALTLTVMLQNFKVSLQR
jgi:hypothetical protein